MRVAVEKEAPETIADDLLDLLREVLETEYEEHDRRDACDQDLQSLHRAMLAECPLRNSAEGAVAGLHPRGPG
jgi:hypothetical protein